MSELRRKSRRLTLTILSGQAATPPISFRDVAMAMVVFPSGWPGEDLSVQTFSAVDDAWVMMYDETGQLLTVTGSPSTAASVPDKVAAADRIRLVNTSGGVVTNLGSNAVVEVALKS